MKNMIQDTYNALNDANIILGVSLSNRKFDRKFVRNLFEWLSKTGANNVLVIIGDQIEIINYEVFGGHSPLRAADIARVRGIDLGTMFGSFERSLHDRGIGFTWRLESDWRLDLQVTGTIHSVDRALQYALEFDTEFKFDLQEQVRSNLQARIERHGSGLIEKHMGMLSKYIIGELSVFFAFWLLYPNAVEIYPGPNMNIKEKICRNEYKSLRGRLEIVDYKYINVAFLAKSHEA